MKAFQLNGFRMVSPPKPAIFPPSFSPPAMIRMIVCLSVFAFLAFVTSAAETRPNIILIMADDMGYEALSANGSESCKSCLLYTSPSPRD